MLECEAYFEAYRYNLDVLQKINFLNNGEGNPLSKFIVQGGSCSSVNLPSYFEAGHLLQLPVACNPQQRKGRRGSVPNSPILIACETNHALDQFLELLLTLQKNVKIVRVGSQSESEELNRCTLYHQRRKLRRNKRNYRDEGGILYDETQIRRQVTGMENKIRALQTEVAALENVSGLLNLGKMWVGKQLLGRIPSSLRNILENEEKCTKWLGIEDITSNGFQVSNVMRSWFNISGFQQRRSRLVTLGTQPKNRKLDLDGEELVVDNGNGQFSLKNGNDVSNYTMGQRWRIYFRLLEIAAEMGRKTSAEKGKQLKEARLKLKAAKDKVNGWILKGTDIIGMTTTGAAKHHLLLEYAKPEIVIIEEAAEILEARLITSLTKDCKQLILIGDHLQLRPRPTVYELERKYHLNVSLFERMILNGVKMCTLKTQHRMRPEISDLITGSVYKTLYNHPSVREYPHVKGVLKSLFFVTHTQPEKHDPNLMSKSNQHEANFIVGLCEYLLLQGYLPTEITVLATYNAQVFLLQKLMPVSCSEVEVTSVDSYQGEENKIILLSLVRSNPEDKIGFVGIENRVCVALSRAKHGLFVVGNLNSFINTSKIWQQIHAKLESGQNCGDGLELKCAQHGRITRVQRGSDFFPLKSAGGCGERCNAKLPCSHLCPQICHGFDRSHEGFKCMEPCERKCKVGYHQCQAECSAECPPCKLPVMWRCKSRIHETFLPCDEPCVGLECCQTQTKEASCQLT
ncbi:NFX1-type zinc finger-containing protein 1 [Orchesella cincta]|uniref:NFX1-type zinc finger-containing protein 1 n=1 Tax=Orchesella cincta TaxID=48709 RepID=A0A1D2MCN1_ORCCI|nr:NFX1-type zinc finger-containing protein 1 [Orchesella cincta]